MKLRRNKNTDRFNLHDVAWMKKNDPKRIASEEKLRETLDNLQDIAWRMAHPYSFRIPRKRTPDED
jgi:hypothetical protein